MNLKLALGLLAICYILALCRRGGQWAKPFTDELGDPMALELFDRAIPPSTTALWIYRVFRNVSRTFSFFAILIWPWAMIGLPIFLIFKGRWLMAIGAGVGLYLLMGILTYLAMFFDHCGFRALAKSVNLPEDELSAFLLLRSP